MFVIGTNSFAQMNLYTNYLGVSKSNVSSNQWHYAVVTKSSNLQGQMYLDGVLIRDTLWQNNSFSYSKLYIGASYYTSFSGFFKGQIDELRISNKVRSQSEIQNYYTSNLPFSVDNNTYALFHFDENTGAVVNNAKGGSGSSKGCTYTIGKFGSSLNLDGISNYADCNISIPTSNITIEFWFKEDGSQSGATLIQPYGMYSSNISLTKSTVVNTNQTICETMGNDSLVLYKNGYITGPQNVGSQPIHTDSKWIKITGADSLYLHTMQHRLYDYSKIYDKNNNLIWTWAGESVPATTWYPRIHNVYVGGNDSVRIEFYQGYTNFSVGHLQVIGMHCGLNCNLLATATTSNPTTICQGGSVIINASIGSNYKYQWYNNGEIINGATTSNITQFNSGSYSVKITDDNGCQNTSLPINVIVNPNPIATILASGPTIFCQGGAVTLTASGGGTYLWSNNSTATSINVSNNGTYSTTVKLNGCSSTASQSITVNPNPIVSLASLNAFINNNSNAITLVGTPSGGTYIGSGISGTSFNPKLAGLGNKTITYNYMNSNNCSGSATRSTIVFDTTGIVCTSTKYDTITTHISVTDTLIIKAHFAGLNNIIGTTEIKIYPNPTSDIIYINTGDFTQLSGSTIKITDALGKSVFSSLINQQLFTINTSQFGARGVYTVQIMDGNQIVKDTRKIVLQ